MSMYAQSHGNNMGCGEEISPVSQEGALTWFENRNVEMDNDVEKYFADLIEPDQPNIETKRLRQVRDALNKCKNQGLVEQIGKLLNI